LQYSLNSNFKSAKLLNVTNNKVTTKLISNLKSKVVDLGIIVKVLLTVPL